VAPTGTVTVNKVAEADVTVAFTPPKYTLLLPAEGLKKYPPIVTVVPTGPEAGEKYLTIGAWAKTLPAIKKHKKTMIR